MDLLNDRRIVQHRPFDGVICRVNSFWATSLRAGSSSVLLVDTVASVEATSQDTVSEDTESEDTESEETASQDTASKTTTSEDTLLVGGVRHPGDREYIVYMCKQCLFVQNYLCELPCKCS